MTGAELLRDANERVAFGWCQGATARSIHGVPVDACGDQAARWSLLGALQAAAFCDQTTRLDDIRGAVAAIADLIDDPSLSHWNDVPERTQYEVSSLLKRAEGVAETAAAS
jgi:hypothetical protein